MTLVARGVSHAFAPGQPVLTGVDLALAPGEAVALIGPNGAGKTTLLRVLAGLLQADGGEVLLDGAALAGMPRRDVAQRVSVVPQSRPPAFAFTALEFVLMGFHARVGRFSLDGPQREAAARDALAAMSVAELADRSMTQISGGEAQRVVMARTLAAGADYWLLDEPTASLDLSHQVALLDAVRQHCDGGGAALAIMHDPNLVPRWFDRAVVLASGVVLAAGPPGEVLSADTFARAFGMRMTYVGTKARGAWIPELDPHGDDDVESAVPAEELR